MRSRATLTLVLLFLASACATSKLKPQMGGGTGLHEGMASWYGQEFAGRLTANGETFDPMLLTAAHRTLPFGSIVEVRNPKNGKSVTVRINDRGPFINNRIIDLSFAAATELDLVRAGVGPVEFSVLRSGAQKSIRTNPGAQSARPQTPAATTDRDGPPPVEFPLPATRGTTRSAKAESEDEFTVEVLEERGGKVVRKQASSDGQTIERVPTSTHGSATVAQPDPAEVDPGEVHGDFFAVQLGSFREEHNAQALRGRVAKMNEPSLVDQKGALFRVRVGPFSTRVKAIEAREKLEAAGFSGFIVQAAD